MYIQFQYAIHLERGQASGQYKAHGLDFIDAPEVFEGLTFTFEDDRFVYLIVPEKVASIAAKAHADSVFKVGWGEGPRTPTSMIRRVPPCVRLVVANPSIRASWSTHCWASQAHPNNPISFVSARDFASFRSAQPTNLANSEVALMRAVPYFHRAECFFQGRLSSATLHDAWFPGWDSGVHCSYGNRGTHTHYFFS